MTIKNGNVRQARDEMLYAINALEEFVDSPLIGKITQSRILALKHWVRLLETSEL